jgi:hypothetical protein
VVDWDVVVLIQAKDLNKYLGQAGRRGLEVDDTLQQLPWRVHPVIYCGKKGLFFAMDAEDDETFVQRVCVVRGARAQSWH